MRHGFGFSNHVSESRADTLQLAAVPNPWHPRPNRRFGNFGVSVGFSVKDKLLSDQAHGQNGPLQEFLDDRLTATPPPS